MYKVVVLLTVSLFLNLNQSLAQESKMPISDEFAHTFSVVAIDEVEGYMAIGVQSHWFNVGRIVPWAKTGVGVIATQSFANTKYGYEGLELLETGMHPEEVLMTLIEEDEGREYRQVAIIDVQGRIASFTGSQCIQSASSLRGEDFSVQANLMANDRVVPVMQETYEKNRKLPLAERVLETLKAAQNEGGDLRGQQSAALIMVKIKNEQNQLNKEPVIDLRVEDHYRPLAELERLLITHRGYELMNKADAALEKKDFALALRHYEKAENLMPDNIELQFWKSIAIISSGNERKGIKDLKKVLKGNINWQKLFLQLHKEGFINVSDGVYGEIENM